MNAAFDTFPLPPYLWQVALHSWIMGLIVYAWIKRARIPSGPTRRRLFGFLLVLPMITAAVPGRSGIEFGEHVAWFNSARLLAIPLGPRHDIADLVLVICVVSIAITLWQQTVPWYARPKTIPDSPPDDLVTLVRSRSGWGNCRVLLCPSEAIVVATSGWPARPTLIVSKGALATLNADELGLAIAHEHAMWNDWLVPHLLFVVRVVQCYNPVALWAFRGYWREVEAACDVRALEGHDPRVLARMLLKIFQSTDRRDAAARSSLRKRVDVLLAGGMIDSAPTATAVAAAAIFFLLVIPWIV